MSTQLQRNVTTATLTIATASTGVGSTAIPFSNAAGGTVHQASGGSITTLTWMSSDDGITFYPLADGAGAAITTTIAAPGAAPIPVQCYGSAFIKAYGDQTGTIKATIKS